MTKLREAAEKKLKKLHAEKIRQKMKKAFVLIGQKVTV